MNDNFAIQLFEGKKVRIVWDAGQEKYYFSVTDIVQVLTDSVNPRDYIKKMLRRPVYDLNGRQYQGNRKNGVFIQNGKKILVKK